MIFIFSEVITSRLEYTCEVIFKHIIKTDYQFVGKELFLSINKSPKINYSKDFLDYTSIWINPHGLLFENTIENQNIEVEFIEGVPRFFKTSDSISNVLRFDLIASTFYLISRYEEYLPFNPDKHGRFSSTESLAFKNGFLDIPVVHLWCEILKTFIQKSDPTYKFGSNKYKHLNTIDIDNAYAYQGKPFLRFMGGLIKSLMNFDFHDLKMRFNYWIKGEDPYNTYDFIKKITLDNRLETIFFITLGKYGTFDKNIPIKKHLKGLIKYLLQFSIIGIHPSYKSNNAPSVLSDEFNHFKSLSDNAPILSRQHYLKLNLPATYENLIFRGVTHDFTMGYADNIGFRAGISIPYPFFNIITNQQRPLMIVPFQIMDGVLKDNLKLSPEDSIELIKKMKLSIKKIDGVFVSVFHNSSLSDTGEWKGWRKVYNEIISK